MKKVYTIKGTEIAFSESNKKNLWYGIWNDISIEFFLDKIDGGWESIEKFLHFFNKNDVLNELTIENSSNLLLCLAEVFWKKKKHCFKFTLSGINFYGLGTSLSSSAFNYELVFDLSDANGDGIDDPYANWLVAMSNNHITGVRREQI
jgi:hypothetical protein